MKKIKYLSPETLDEAFSLYNSHKNSVYFAGGTDVIVKLKENKLECDYLISLKKIVSMNKLFIDKKTGELHIGSLITHHKLETSHEIQKKYPIIYDAVSNIGSVQVRNIATIGGNIVNAVPSADGAIPLITLDAKVVYYGENSFHLVELKDFFLEPSKTILKRGEIVTEFIIPSLPKNSGGAYIKFGRRSAMELPLIGVGVQIAVDDDFSKCVKAAIGLGVAGPTPIRASNAEEFLIGNIINEENLKEAGEIAASEAKVRDSIRGEAWHRREMIKVFVKRLGLKALTIAKQRAN